MESLKTLALKCIGADSYFDAFLNQLENFHAAPCHSFADLKEKNTKLKGDMFELFCKRYLLTVFGCQEAYLYAEIPGYLKTQLGLTSKQDMGIDIVAIRNGKYFAVQCKYKRVSDNPRNNVVSWSSISTFYALTARSGPWEKLIIMTTGTSVRRVGGYTSKDLTIARGTFGKITQEHWYKIFDIAGSKVEDHDPVKMIEARLKRFELS